MAYHFRTRKKKKDNLYGYTKSFSRGNNEGKSLIFMCPYALIDRSMVSGKQFFQKILTGQSIVEFRKS